MSNRDSDSGTDTAARTVLLLTGVSPSDVDAEFLKRIHELAEERGLSVESISVGDG